MVSSKDSQSDEPDNGASISITVPKELTAVSNGRLVNKQDIFILQKFKKIIFQRNILPGHGK